MSKQIYIDSNGNEVQVSGTVNTADMMPMSGNDSTKVSTAIGDLSSLTTSVTSSLVGAVNEVNANKAEKTDIAVNNSTLSVKTGVSITLARSQVWKSHGLAFVSCAFTANANIGSGTDILTTPSGYSAVSLTDLVGTDNANNGKPFYISGNTITANGNLTSGASYFINGVFRTTA